MSGRPFVPKDNAELHVRCAEIFGVQVAGLAKRLSTLPADTPLSIGISGGLDSTLSLLVAVKTCEALGSPTSRIHAMTLPGFGTTGRTKKNALELMRLLKVASEEIDIRSACLEAIKDLHHKPFGVDLYHPSVDIDKFDVVCFVDLLKHMDPEQRKRGDLVFENIQARYRTYLLMSRGFVIGTGDMTELALGWATYNGDHMSMYNPNCSVPKTLVKFLVRYVAENQFGEGNLRNTLLDIVDTTISRSCCRLVQTTRSSNPPKVYSVHLSFTISSYTTLCETVLTLRKSSTCPSLFPTFLAFTHKKRSSAHWTFSCGVFSLTSTNEAACQTVPRLAL